MAQKTNKSYREPYIGMKIVAGPRGVFSHTILITGFKGKNAILASKVHNGIQSIGISDLKSAIEGGFWAELIQFKDYYEAITKNRG